MAIAKLLPVLLKNKDTLLEDGLDPRAHAQRGANTGISYGRKAATAPLKAWENIPRLVVRGLQFVLGLVIVGLYGHRVDEQRRAEDASLSPEWVFGLVVAGLSCVTAVAFAAAAPFGAVSNRFKTARLFSWDLTLFLLWIVVFGIFGGIFLHRDGDDSYKGSSTAVEKGAVWVDLVNAILWLVSGTYGFVKTFMSGKVDTLGEKVTGKVFGKKQPAPNKMEMYETV
ncbi:putative uracil phosphoribosyltransferase [Diaporthe ampelina]|uniref:Putative uracil phosphoribosyltransferase n=1 Tax=Diaporthe ampelina TaxID=1214573 RepID=A0A0G2FMX9_9PEZI|nr:putative uracil phosphoribosyltransferase [Diaporthe ampelina]